MNRLAIIGAGSWGTALAIAVSSRFDEIRIWAREPKRAAEIARSGENSRYLPGFRLPENVSVSSDLETALKGAAYLLSAVPSAHLRNVFMAAHDYIHPDAAIVSATKGIEERSLKRMSQVLAETLGTGGARIGVLSGPAFAKEVAAGEPAAVVIAAADSALAARLQHAFATTALRLYTSSDVVGVEVGAALKNVIAIGAGICRGLGLGSNCIAALVTRGLAEITRLAVKMGGDPRTLSGLAGLGDLVLTATGDLSRNRYVGVRLGQGHKLNDILSAMPMIAEGVATCSAAYQLGIQYEADLPIVAQMHAVLYEGKDPREAVRELMDRPLTCE